MRGVQLAFDTIDRFNQVFLVAAREGHAGDGVLDLNQRLVNCGLLGAIHWRKCEPEVPLGASPGARGLRRPDTPKKEPRRRRRGSLVQLWFVRTAAYFAGAVEEESLDFEECFLWWCFLWLVVDDLAGAVSPAGAGSAASTGPAIRARAITGISFLNIDVSPG